MARIVWLLEADVYGREIEPLVREIRRQEMSCELIGYRELAKASVPTVDGKPVTRDDCVIVYGTYPTVRQAQLHSDWSPVGWLDPESFDCAAYYPHFAPFLLNRSHAVLTGVEAIRRADALFAEYGTSGEVFARPTGVHKLFVGRRIAREDWETALAPTRYDSDTRILVAAPQEIGREWRVVVVGDEVIAGSQYAIDGVRTVSSECSSEAVSFVQTVLQGVTWRPAEVFMMDVCESNGTLRVVELNAFNCSWLYACDLPCVVRKVSEQAAKDWRQRRDQHGG
jgi:hypothetical protein